jgi:hypothetical protein
VKPAETAVSRERLCKHIIISSTKEQATIGGGVLCAARVAVSFESAEHSASSPQELPAEASSQSMRLA